MRSRSIFLLTAILMIGAGCAKQPSGTHASQPSRGVAVGQPAPAIALKDIDGKPVTLAQFRGKPVFINTFATWCPPCKQELPDIVKAYPQYKGKVVFLGIDEQEDAELVIPFLKRFGITYQVALDPGSFADTYEVSSLPASFFIDTNGIVQKVYRGFMTPAAFKDNIATIYKS
jgi:cytochrome c biogenesis protein CcmG/thiol:disulfide interchange protein DsbE